MTKSFIVLILIATLMSLIGLQSFTLFDVDEAVFAQATKEMVRSGDYITPTYNGENRYDKPILFYWLMAIAYKIFGINEFSARLPSAVAGVLLSSSIFLFLRKLIDEKTALFAGVSFTLSIYYLTYSHAAVTDMVLTLFISLSLFSFYFAFIGHKKYIYGFYVFSALSFLTKGLIGIIFPFTIAFLFVILTKRLREIRNYINWKALLLFLLIALPWYVAQIIINGEEFIQYFFIKHHFKRYTGVISGHKGPLFYYIPALLIGFFPWIAYLPFSLKGVFESLKRLLKEKIIPNSDQAQVALFAFIWFSLIFLFFSFSTTKLPNYILPSIPALSILIGISIVQVKEKWLRLSNFSIAFIGFLLGAGLIYSKKYLERFGIENPELVLYLSIPLFFLSVLSTIGGLRSRNFFEVKALITAVFLLSLTFKAIPLANKFLQGTLHEFSKYAKEVVPENQRVYVYRLNKPSIVFYSDRKVERLNRKEEIENLQKGEIVIVKTKDLESLCNLDIEIIDRRIDYAIFKR